MAFRMVRFNITAGRLLLVEGKDEENLFRPLMKACGDTNPPLPEIQIHAAGGKNRFPAKLEAVRLSIQERRDQGGAPFHALGIVRDANGDPMAAFQSVADAVRRCGLQPPGRHAQFSNAAPAIGIFIVPDGSSPGAIETLCRCSVAGTHVAACVEDYIACLEQDGDSRSSASIDKTFAHAYLAAGPNPVARVGEGAQAGAWDLDHAAFAALRGFVTELARRGI